MRIRVVEYEDYTLQGVIHLMSDQGFICYGYGKAFKRFRQDILEPFGLVDKLSGIIDMDKNKAGTWTDGDKPVAIYPPSELMRFADKPVVITTLLFEEIESVLDSVGFSGKIFRYTDIINKSDVYLAQHVKLPDSLRVYDSEKIPRVIHYCWFGRGELPDLFKRCIDSWHKYCPDYEIREWNEDNYDITKNAYMRKAYECGKWGFVPDYARLDLIYKYGGIYLDTDVELIKPLDDFLYEDGFAGCEPRKKVAFGLGFGARKKLDIIGELLELYDRLQFHEFNKKSEMANNPPSPTIMTDYLEKNNGYCWKNEIVEIQGLRIYPPPVLCGKMGKEFVLTENTYSIHHYAATWVPED